jgi:colanic acid/amylovoran biosynthesis glycosyltransferase
MKKPHIVEVVGNYPAQTFLMRHLEALSHLEDIKISVASKGPPSYEEASIQRIEQDHFPVVYLPDSRQPLRHQMYQVIRSLPAQATGYTWWNFKAKALARSFAVLAPDLVHFQFGELAVMMFDYVSRLNIPYTVSLRGADIQERPLADPDFAVKLRQVLKEAAGIHTVCDAFGDQAREFCDASLKTTTIRTCLPLMERCIETKPMSLRFITVGRLHWRKAFDDLIRAMIYLPDAQLEIIGDGPEYPHLQYVIHLHQLQDRVRILGNLPFHQFSERLCSASAYVQSSVAEGFSNALAEAMMIGQAVFATPVGGTDEVINDGVNGVLLPIGDPRGIAEKLALGTQPEFLIRIGEGARRTAQELFDMAHHAQQFSQFYQNALAKHG